MSDYRTPNDPLRNSNDPLRNPNDPLRYDTRLDPNAPRSNAAWGWIAGAVLVVAVLAVAFGIGHTPNQAGTDTASNDTMNPPAATRMAPPVTNPAPANPAPPITPAPNTPAQRTQP